MALCLALVPGSTGCSILRATSMGAPLALLRHAPWKTKPKPPRPSSLPCLISSGRTRYLSPKSRKTCKETQNGTFSVFSTWSFVRQKKQRNKIENDYYRPEDIKNYHAIVSKLKTITPPKINKRRKPPLTVSGAI